ncbi:restriction endonuclease subunit S [Ligilactobacillus salivarius]|uniref:restriction endonuclease subunit S n=1 Tax=Ligilactobacillus salivarius TaxID=1624 RepID=UPI000BD28D23|nr:restriction endonuclease subunit S [Ligilactobacillus salivarius]PAY33058.1 hypothetical protein A8C54_02295 [Ligilactobacillus salivarius]PAY38283.1 hypothetical protein A8C34_01830 [Ligilactobacillus salivarius]
MPYSIYWYCFTWERKKLGDVAEIVGGGTPSTTKDNYWNGSINWYTPAEIGDKIFIDNSQRKITNLGLKNSSAKILPAGTMLFTSRAGIGKTAILKEEGSTNQGFQSIIPNVKLLDSYFIYSMSNILKKYGESHGAGSTFIEISGKELAKAKIFLPSLIEQKYISKIIYSIDDTIQLHEDYLQLLHSFKIFLAQKMFFDDDVLPLLRFNGFTEKWSQCKLNDHTIVTMGQSPNSKNYTNNQNDEILVQGNADLYKNKVLKRVFTTEITKTAVKNDILISVRAPVGDTARNQYKSVVIGRGIASIKGNDFLYYQLEKMKNSGFWHKYIAGSTFESITGKDLKNAKIYTTSNDEERKIGGVFSSLTRIIQLYEHKIDSLKKLKQFLLQNMFV